MESEPTGWFNIPVPPRFDETMRPILLFVVREKDSVVIEISNNVKNHRVKKIYNIRLKVAEYNIKYGDEDLTVAADSLRDGRITIKQPGEGLKV